MKTYYLDKRFVIAFLLSAAFPIIVNAQSIPAGDLPCEMDWAKRTKLDSVPNQFYLKTIERDAQRGDIAAQLRLGALRRTDDGAWKTTDDYSYNIQWLEKAKEQGSKSAVWELAKFDYRVPPLRKITHETYLKTVMEAAEIEGNPWAATELMQLTNGRRGISRKPNECLKEIQIDGRCAPEELLPVSTAEKWAKIAAESGNAAAQEWLCGRHKG